MPNLRCRLGSLVLLLCCHAPVQSAQNLYWRHSQTGESYQHLLQGSSRLHEDFVRPLIGTDWQAIAKGDFNGDGEQDLFWRHAQSGQTAFQQFQYGQHQAFRDFLTVGSDWQLAAAADFDGDGISDLAWVQPQTGEVYVFLLDSQGIKAQGSVFALSDPAWQLQAVADIDGNQREDWIFQHQSSGLVWRIELNGLQVEQSQALFQLTDLNWQLNAMADLDGDGKADMVWRNRLTGDNYQIYLDGSQRLAESFAPSVQDPGWQLQALLDLDGDDKAEWLWWNPSSGQLVAWQFEQRQFAQEWPLLTSADGWQLQYGLKARLKPETGLSYGESPAQIPGRIEAEFYDKDGDGLAFSDSTAGNSGMALRNDAVDVEACTDQGGGFNLGYIAAGEWLHYSVQVNNTGYYRMRVRVAAQDTASALHLELNGRDLTGRIETPVTGGWQTWTSVESQPFRLEAGLQRLKLVFDGELFNVNYLELFEVGEPGLTAPQGLSALQQGAQLLLAWQSTGASQYWLERRAVTDNGWQQIAVSGNQYRDSPSWGVSYQYRVRSRDGARSSDPSSVIEAALQASIEQGKARYASQCASCHGADGSGGPFKIPLNASCTTCQSPQDLAKVIEATMPKGQPELCDAQCAQDLAAFIGDSFVNNGQQPGSCSLMDLPRRSLRLLTRAEYQATIEQIFGVDQDLSLNLPVEPRVRGYDNNAQVSIVTSRHVDEYLSAATEVARWVETHQAMPFACQTGTSLNQCAQSFIPSLGLRLFRRFLTQDENTRYQALFSEALTDGKIEQGMQLVLQAMLVSPSFLYRSEVGSLQADGRYRLTDFEIASSLSFLLWGSTPDETLLTEAGQNRLNTAEQIQNQAKRLLQDPKAARQLSRFASMWLGTDKLTSVNKDLAIYPAFTSSVREAMMAEFQRFFTAMVFEQGARYADLLTTSQLWVNADLAQFYGLAGQFGSELKLVTDPALVRGGILTLGSVLASHAHSNESSPIKRGKFVRDRLLCQDLPPPPPNLDTTPPGLDPTLTTRARFARHTADAACASCHQYIDSVGFGFEAFDGVGQFRPTENGLAIDQSGSVLGLERLTDPAVKPFSGPRELAQHIADSQAGPACMARQYYRFALGVSEQAADECEITKLVQHFASQGYSVQSLMLALIAQDAFVWRQAGGQ